MGNEEPSGQQAVGEPALVCGCGWEGSYADLNETAEGMTCPKCRLSRNMDCVATPPAQEGGGGEHDGYKEAAIAWAVCASIHREYAKGRDPLYTTRQADYMKAHEAARTKAMRATQEGTGNG